METNTGKMLRIIKIDAKCLTAHVFFSQLLLQILSLSDGHNLPLTLSPTQTAPLLLLLTPTVTDAPSSLNLAPNQTDWGGNHHTHTHASYTHTDN